MQAHRKNWKITGTHWKVRNRTGNLLYGELTHRIIGLCYEIHFQYGSGQKESLYQNALAEKPTHHQIPFTKEISIDILSSDTNEKLGNHRLDFVVDQKIVVETKAIKFTPIKLEQQLFSYL